MKTNDNEQTAGIPAQPFQYAESDGADREKRNYRHLLAQIDESLERHELLKINILETAGISGKLCAGELAEALGADVVQVIGAKVTLYRPASDPEKRTIELP